MGLFEMFRSKRPFNFRLYIVGETQHAAAAQINIKHALDEIIGNEAYYLDVLILAQSLKQAGKDGVVSTPTLILGEPPPIKKITGRFHIISEVREMLKFVGDIKIEPPAGQEGASNG